MSKRFRYYHDGVSTYQIWDAYKNKIIIKDVTDKDRAIGIVSSWNLQEYEGIDDTEGHL